MEKSATVRKVTLLHECFSDFLNCANGTKLRKPSRVLLSFSPFLRFACSTKKNIGY